MHRGTKIELDIIAVILKSKQAVYPSIRTVFIGSYLKSASRSAAKTTLERSDDDPQGEYNESKVGRCLFEYSFLQSFYKIVTPTLLILIVVDLQLVSLILVKYEYIIKANMYIIESKKYD